MRLLEAAVAGVIAVVVVAILVHHLALRLDLVTLSGVVFLAMFVAVLLRPMRDRGR